MPVERAKVHDWMRKMHEETLKVRVKNFEVLDWSEKVPDEEFVSASLLGAAKRKGVVLSFDRCHIGILFFFDGDLLVVG